MPDLRTALEDQDTGFLRIMAELWGLEINQVDPANLLNTILQGLSNAQLVKEMLESLPPQALQALQDLVRNKGKLTWMQFCRKYGELRIMGESRRERDQPHLHPISTTEWLWYRGLISKAFFDLPPEPQEYAYLPDEFMLSFEPEQVIPIQEVFGKPMDPEELKVIHPASDRILDDACTLLAALRSGTSIEDYIYFKIPTNILKPILASAGFMDEHNKPNTEKTRLFLEAPRAEALLQLASAWMGSNRFNELALLPELICEGRLKNNPLQARQTLLGLIRNLPQGEWRQLQAFIQDVHDKMPDFLRPAGDYDAWFIRERDTREYLRGFEHWDKVEGRLISFVITCMLHWLGITDLAAKSAGESIYAFRLSTWSEDILNRRIPKGFTDEKEKVAVQSNGKVSIPRLAPRAARYQMARFCDWQGEKDNSYRYRITAQALQRAKSQKLKVSQFIALLHKYGKPPLPPSLLHALQRWEKHHSEVLIEKSTILQTKDAAIFDQLEKSRAKRFIIERFTPTLMLIKAGGEDAVQQALTELGYLADISTTL